MQPTLGPQEVFQSQLAHYNPVPPQTPAVPERVAILVAHGMGQQVPYETIEGVAYAVKRGAINANGTITEPTVRYVRLGTTGNPSEPELMRAEFITTDRHNVTREVHIYEAYWAPLTEGKVKAKDVISFLWDAGWNGVWNTNAGTFKRWMFGDEREFKLNKIALLLTFFAIMSILAALLFINSVVAAAATSHAIGMSTTFPSGRLLVGLTWDLFVIDIAGIVIVLGIWIGQLKSRIGSLVAWFAIVVGVLAILYSAALIGLRLMSFIQPDRFSPAGLWLTITGWSLAVFVLWAAEFAAARYVRSLLIEYPGDVAAYIAAHSVSKFWEVRQQIWQTTMRVARSVYQARTADDSAYLYEKVIVAGHSLGSVIGYDLLNGLILEDGFSSASLRIPERTRMLLTFGSPLDKTAFLFRTQQDMQSPVREVAATAVQPMIADYNNRPREWVNLWSPADIVSGSLDYYDCPNQRNARHPAAASVPHPKAVNNIPDPDAHTPLMAHIQYWDGALFAEHLYRGITT